MKKIDPQAITAMKGVSKIPVLTAYTTPVARILDQAGIPFILVGDSLGTTDLGYSSTLPVTLDDMLLHTAAVVRGAATSLVVGDMPFLSYQESEAQAIRNCGRMLAKTGCGAVKLEGGEFRAPLIAKLVQNGIPVCAHIGLTPQSSRLIGHKVQGRSAAAAAQLLADARAVADAGAFAIVVECVPSPLGAEVTRSVPVPVIGIGAGPGCDGQVLVLHDILGLGGDFHPKFAKQYIDLAPLLLQAFSAYAGDGRSGAYPAPEHEYN